MWGISTGECPTTSWGTVLKVFGITGSIAAGKSEVERLVGAHWPVIDADVVSREVVEPGAEGLTRIVEAFGNDVLDEDGRLNRVGLRNIIAHSKEAQLKLNGIMHPLIIGTIQNRLEAMAQKGQSVAFVSAALMIESGSYKNYNEGVILVTAPDDIRLDRLLQRDAPPLIYQQQYCQ